MFHAITFVLISAGVAAYFFDTKNEKNKKKRCIEIMKDIINSKSISLFNLKSKVGDELQFYYIKNNYSFNVLSTPSQLVFDLKLTTKNITLLEFKYDKMNHEIINKSISEKIIHEHDKDLQIAENFITWLINQNWISDTSFEIKESIDSHYKSKTIESPSQINSLKEKIEQASQDNFFNNDLKREFIKIINLIDEVKNQLENCDLETKHQFNQTMKKDLEKLLDSYLNLEDNQKDVYQADITNSLLKIKSKINKIQEQNLKQNEKEIKKILNLIDERY